MKKAEITVPQRAIQTTAGGPVHIRLVQTSADQGLMELAVDYSRAEIPERAYYADYCNIERARTDVSLTFGKLIPGTSTLRTKIEIAFPQLMFTKQLWGSSRDFHESVRRVAASLRLEPVSAVQDTEKVQTFRANNVFMGLWGEESVLDFYYISPRDFYMFRSSQRTTIALEPVVRVVVGTALMNEFLEKCTPFVEQAELELNASAEGGQ